jgi:hypothetical protein
MLDPNEKLSQKTKIVLLEIRLGMVKIIFMVLMFHMVEVFKAKLLKAKFVKRAILYLLVNWILFYFKAEN